MNAIQKRYINAKASLELAEKQERRFEIEFMEKKNIVNDDGSKARRVYHIEDEELFDEVNKEYEVAVNDCGIWGRYLKAKEAYKAAEKEIVKFALDVIPAGMGKLKEDLKRGAETNLKVRNQLIETVLKLDTRTLTK